MRMDETVYTQCMKNMSMFDQHCSAEFPYLSRDGECCSVSLCGDVILVPVDLQNHACYLGASCVSVCLTSDLKSW